MSAEKHCVLLRCARVGGPGQAAQIATAEEAGNEHTHICTGRRPCLSSPKSMEVGAYISFSLPSLLVPEEQYKSHSRSKSVQESKSRVAANTQMTHPCCWQMRFHVKFVLLFFAKQSCSGAALGVVSYRRTKNDAS